MNRIQPDSFTILNGNTTILFHYNTTPVVQGLNTMHIPPCAFDCGWDRGRIHLHLHLPAIYADTYTDS